MISLDITVSDIVTVMDNGYTVIRIYSDTTQDGTFTTLQGAVTLVENQSGYTFVDADGTSARWYKVAYYGAVPSESSKSEAQQGGTVDAYCTALEVRTELSTGAGDTPISQVYDNVIWNMCVEASRLIDDYKGVEAGAYLAGTDDSNVETRYFDGSGNTRQFIDYAVRVDTVEVDETDSESWVEWAETDFYTWPYNGLEPIWRLVITGKTGGTKSYFPCGRKNVRVTGIFGISETPPETIKRACKIQAARWFKRAQQSWQDGVSSDIGQLIYAKQLDPEVKLILDKAFPKGVRL